MTFRTLLTFLLLFSFATVAHAQKGLDTKLTHFRVVALDHMVTGADNVTKPAHADDPGVLAFVATIRGNIALVEYTFADYKSADKLRADFAAEKDPRFVAFEKAHEPPGKVKAAAIAAGFSKAEADKMYVRVR